MSLREYKAKRDFAQTAEPKGGKSLPKKVRGASRFVIQKHDATRLHYDFRLEMDGVLKSWAVPKGLPWKQGEKHLAVEVEDHPIEYETFEGVIPEGNYGGGTVMVWDRGQYLAYGEQPLRSLREGKLHLVLNGEKAKGEWTLVRIRGSDQKNQWLMLKTGSSTKPISKKLDDCSVKTGRTMEQISDDRDAEWESGRRSDQSPVNKFKARIRNAVEKPGKQKPATKSTGGRQQPKVLIDIPKSLPAARPRFIEPMKPRLLEAVPTHGTWSYELKFDGIRIIAIKNKKSVRLISRNGNDLSVRFAEVRDAVAMLSATECVVDGEVVVLDDEGRSSFQLLQSREMEREKRPIYFYAFDLLQINGRSLLGLSLTERKLLLEQLCQGAIDPIRFSGSLGGDGQALLDEVKRRGLEGIIGKQPDSIYEAGRRSGAWVKLKSLNEQEFVVGGYTPPQGARKYFGALLVGYYKKKKLLFAGKVGTGFDTKTLAALYRQFKKEERKSCPFADLPMKRDGQWVQDITPAVMNQCHWINPVFVAQVKFGEWTRDLKLRQPVFLGLRDDKEPRDVIAEK